MPQPEVGEEHVVLGVWDHVVDVVRLLGVLERLPGFDLAAGEIEPMDAGEAVVLRPDLAVDVRALRAHHVDLGGVDVLLLGELPVLEFLGLAVELDERGLVHVAEPQIAVLVGAQRQESGREARLVLGHRIFGDLAGLGIEPAEVLLAEARVPGDAILIDDHVVGFDGFTRQVVFGVDHARGAAARPRHRVELEAPLRLAS